MAAPDDYRAFLLSNMRNTMLAPKDDEQEGEHPEFAPNQLADALAMALGRFANEKGELKVATPGPSISPSV